MRVFVTGIRGFIGSHLTQELIQQGHEVKGIDNLFHPSLNRVDFVYGDVRYKADMEKFVEWCDVVLHLAAQIHVDKSIENPQETIDINVLGTLNVLDLCRKYDKRMVFASTSEVYGTAQTSWMKEDHQLDAQSPYAASKVAGDRLCKAYYETYETDVRILRNFNTFGPFQNDTSYGGVIAIFTKAALEGKPLKIFGDGTQARDYMYIDDAVQGYKLMMNHDEMQGEVMNCGTGRTIIINELADMIIRITRSKSKIIHVDSRPGEVQRLCASVTKADFFGFDPTTNFERDLKKYIKWYKKFKKLYENSDSRRG